MEEGIAGFCTEMQGLLQVVGYVLLIFKIVIPIIIVALGVMDLGKAVTSGKDEDIKKNTKSLGIRIAAGFLIFLAPNIIIWAFSLVSGFSDAKNAVDFETCKDCLLNPIGSCHIANTTTTTD